MKKIYLIPTIEIICTVPTTLLDATGGGGGDTPTPGNFVFDIDGGDESSGGTGIGYGGGGNGGDIGGAPRSNSSYLWDE